jgi:heme/copper-type cytochrome/quinol oxidase subunit 1
MHRTVMMLLYATPNVFGFANAVLPLRIGSPDTSIVALIAFSIVTAALFGLLADRPGRVRGRCASHWPPTRSARRPR